MNDPDPAQAWRDLDGDDAAALLLGGRALDRDGLVASGLVEIRHRETARGLRRRANRTALGRATARHAGGLGLVVIRRLA